ncbi:MAG: hypothetical protein RLY87_562 [Chloroflexota bacterium]|jgi:hypothetical protein
MNLYVNSNILRENTSDERQSHVMCCGAWGGEIAFSQEKRAVSVDKQNLR